MNNNNIKFDNLQPSQLEILYRLTQQLNGPKDEQNLLSTILEELIQETGAEVGAFIYYDSKKKSFETRLIKSSSEDKPGNIAFSNTVCEDVIASSQAVLTFDTRQDKNFQDKKSVIMNDIHAILAFPLIIKAQAYGIMYFDSRRNRQGFNESARQFLSFFSTIASLALEQVLQKEAIEKENVLLKNQLELNIQVPTLVGKSEGMQKIFRLIHKVSQSDVPVIISGENGTGKDLVARAIHDFSTRNSKPYIAQYIGNIPDSLVESELFGYKRGSFTGANKDKIGLFEAANTGTLFLDEIADLSPDLQVKLLRVLQNQEIRRLGENAVRKVDVRILAATNRDLAQMVKNGTFREDLYYRLNVITIQIPALRERLSDIDLLAEHFLKTSGVRLSKDALRKLTNYHWPGNVRQLDNILKRALLLAESKVIEADDIQLDMEQTSETDLHLLSGTMEEIKNLVIRQRLNFFDGNKTHTAKSLNISLRSLQAKAKELDI